MNYPMHELNKIATARCGAKRTPVRPINGGIQPMTERTTP